MDNKMTYTKVRQNFKATLDEVAVNNSVITIQRRSGNDVVLISADDFRSMEETIYLLSNINNLKHLEESLKELKSGKTIKLKLSDL
jgi:antitoxin YefM